VVIGGDTRRLLGGLFEYRDLGKVPVKGFDDPVTVWQVTGVGALESRFEALRATTTPLIGREEEIDLLLRRWEQAKRGEGSVVLVSGEPGIGKSRIAETILERLSNEPHIRIRYFCSPHTRIARFIRSSRSSNGRLLFGARIRLSNGWTSLKRCWLRRPTT